MWPVLRVWWLRLARNGKVLWGTSIFATVAAVLCVRFDLLDIGQAEIDAYDDGITTLTEWTTEPEPSDDIVIVAIDDKTLQAVSKNKGYALTFGSWPYSRNVWARVFEHVANEGARAIVFDGIFDEPHTDPSGDVAMGSTIAGLKVPVFVGFNVSQSSSTKAPQKVETPTNRRPKAGADTAAADARASEPSSPSNGQQETFEDEEETFDEDEAFGEEETFGEEEAFGEEETFGDGPKGAAEVSAAAVAQALAFPVKTEGDLELPSLADAEDRMRYPVPPIDPLIDTISGFGLVITEEDEDGKMRRTRFAYQDGVNTYVTLSVAVLADLWGADEVTIAPGALKIGDRSVRINPTGDAEIDYGGELTQRFRTISLINVLDDWLEVEQATEKGVAPQKALEDGLFKDKVVIIAGFALGTADVKATPFAAQTPGVVKQAAEIQNLLDGAFIVEAPFWLSVLVTFAIAFFSVAVVLIFQHVLLEVSYPLVLFYGFFVVTGVFLVHDQLHILSAMPSWAAAFCGTVVAVYNHVFVSKERERLKEAFAGRLREEDLRVMVEQKAIPKLDGEVRDVTILVTDINDFSALAARFEGSPERLARLLNNYLTTVTDIVLEHGGHVIKYVGDTVECVFGAPLDHPDHAARAARAAFAIRRVADAVDLGVTPQERDRFHTRSGITSVRTFVGNFGSEQAPEYTVLGGKMRQAIGIARANENLKTRILLGPQTLQQAGDYIKVRQVAQLELVPGEGALPLYELEGMKK